MAGIIKLNGFTAAISSLLTTELNSTANSTNTAASAAIDNTANLDLWCDLTLTLATQGVARSIGARVAVYLIAALDGTNYDDVNETTAEVWRTFPFDAATTARQVTRFRNPVGPGLYKVFARNLTGQTLAASGNLLEARFYSLNGNA